MPRPERCLPALLALLALGVAAQETPPDPGALDETVAEALLSSREDWYRVELLIFARGIDALAAEAWDPLPVLEYPDSYRFLVDPELTDRRLLESEAIASRIDARGVQTLLLPRPPVVTRRPDGALVSPEPNRPDVDIVEPPADEEPAAAPGAGGDDGAGSGPVAGESSQERAPEPPGATDDAAPEELAEQEAAPQGPLLALPYVLESADRLAFAGQAQALARRGEQVLFHGAFWAPLAEDAPSTSLVLDRGADDDVTDWPALQGAITLYRSRYLHAEVALWLNTDGSYLPQGWSIPAPPLPTPSLLGTHLDGEPADPFAPAPRIENQAAPPGSDDASADVLPGALRPAGDSAPGRAAPRSGADRDAFDATPGLPARGATDVSGLEPEAPGPAPGEAPEDAEAGPGYPYSHAIVHRQSRRMRSGELHYLDHPVIGVVIKLTPADESLLPLSDPAGAEWRSRHALPVERVPAPVPDDMPDVAPADQASVSPR